MSGLQTLSLGSRGFEVESLQQALNARPPSGLALLNADGIYGPKTQARVREFQASERLVADGIAGPKTWAALAAGLPKQDPGPRCGNGDPGNQARAVALRQSVIGSQPQVTRALAGNTTAGDDERLKLPTNARPLTEPQRTAAERTFGQSLDFTRILISDGQGLQGRPFTAALAAIPGMPRIVVINCGTFTPDNDTLIHELTHAWQSQHHSDPAQFMRNAVGSQALAVTLNASSFSFDPFFPFDAYASVPGPVFESFAAEQIATQVEKGIAATVNHVKLVAKNAVDSKNVTSLSKTRVGFVNAPGSIR